MTGTAMTDPMEFISEFMRGQFDCQKGLDHKPGQSEAYDRGYSAQYHLEQCMTKKTEANHG